MHDCKGRELTVGDVVLVPFIVKDTFKVEDYCNLSLETVAVMFPGDRPTFLTLNTKQVIRANAGDSTDYRVTVGHNGRGIE